MAALGSSRGIRRALTLSLGLNCYNKRVIRGYIFYIHGHVDNARPGDRQHATKPYEASHAREQGDKHAI